MKNYTFLLGASPPASMEGMPGMARPDAYLMGASPDVSVEGMPGRVQRFNVIYAVPKDGKNIERRLQISSFEPSGDGPCYTNGVRDPFCWDDAWLIPPDPHDPSLPMEDAWDIHRRQLEIDSSDPNDDSGIPSGNDDSDDDDTGGDTGGDSGGESGGDSNDGFDFDEDSGTDSGWDTG